MTGARHTKFATLGVRTAYKGSIEINYYELATFKQHQHRYLIITSILHVAVSSFQASSTLPWNRDAEIEHAVL